MSVIPKWKPFLASLLWKCCGSSSENNIQLNPVKCKALAGENVHLNELVLKHHVSTGENHTTENEKLKHKEPLGLSDQLKCTYVVLDLKCMHVKKVCTVKMKNLIDQSR